MAVHRPASMACVGMVSASVGKDTRAERAISMMQTCT